MSGSKPSTHDLLAGPLSALNAMARNSVIETSPMPYCRSAEGYAMTHIVLETHGGSDDTSGPTKPPQ
jgi:hypothetical protein